MNSKAIGIIQDAVEEPHMYPEGGLAVYVAQELEKENVLVPDPPKPENIYIEDIDTYLPIWEVGDYSISSLVGLGINIETPRHKDPTPADVARKVAYAILAAANYVEGKVAGTTSRREEKCMTDKKLTVGELIEALSQYDPEQIIYVMARNSDVSPVVEVSLHTSDEAQGPDNPLSISSESTWE